jgi:hypothetical protein
MLMDVQLRIATATATLDAMSKYEATQILTNSKLGAVPRQLALARIKRASDEYKAIVDALPTAGAGGFDTMQLAQIDCTLTFVEAVITYSPTADMRAAQLYGYRQLDADHQSAIAAAKSGAGMETAASLTSKIGSAAKILQKIAKNPADYIGALQFWNKLVKPDPGLKKFQLLPNPEGEAPTFDDLVNNDLSVEEVFKEFENQRLGAAQVKQIMKSLQLTAKDLQIAASWLGAAVVLLSVTTIVLNTLSDEKHWATALANSSFAVGAPILLSSFITAASVAPAVNAIAAGISAAATAAGSLFGAGAVTIEVPPVAMTLVAIGVVVAVGIALSELFSFLLDTIFGGDIPPSMRVEMAIPMTMSMRTQMAMPMSISLH